MKRALLAFVCAFALSAPAFAAGSFTLTGSVTGASSLGNATTLGEGASIAQAAGSHIGPLHSAATFASSESIADVATGPSKGLSFGSVFNVSGAVGVAVP
jgi:hypothetical protein